MKAEPEVVSVKRTVGSASRKCSVTSSASNAVVTNTVTNVNAQPKSVTANKPVASRKHSVTSSVSNANSVTNAESQPEGVIKRTKVNAEPEVVTVKITVGSVSRKCSVTSSASKANSVTNAESQPEDVTVKRTVGGRKHSVTSSASNAVIKSRRLESFGDGKTDTDHDVEVIDIAGSSSSEGTNKENVVTVASV